MEKIDTKKYKGFTTDFYILPKIKTYLDDKNINIKDYLIDDFHWYKDVLFELLNPKLSKNWTIEKENRKKFKVIIYAIIKKYPINQPEGFAKNLVQNIQEFVQEDVQDHFKYDKDKELIDSNQTLHSDNDKPFAIKFKVVVES